MEPILSGGGSRATVTSVRRLSVAVFVSILVTAGVGVPGSARAHSDRGSVPMLVSAPVTDVLPSAPLDLRAAPPGTVHPLWLLSGVLAGVLLGVFRPRPRRALVLLLVLLLGAFVVENGVHSVHHLGERAASCAIAAAASHLVVATDDAAPVLHARVVVASRPADPAAGQPSGPSLGRDPARAPPAPIA